MRTRLKIRALIHVLALLAVALVWLGPYLWMVGTSFRSLEEIVAAPAYPIPSRFRLEAYAEVFSAIPVGRYLFNTLTMATLIGLLQVLLALPAGYALAKLKFRGRRVAFFAIVACLMIPAQVTFVPVFTLLGQWGIINTMAALVVPFAVSAFGTFLVRQAMLAVPDEIVEAARLDGASELYIIYRILGPMVAPTLAAMFLFSFVFHYSDYFWPLMMTTDEHVRTLPLAVALLLHQPQPKI